MFDWRTIYGFNKGMSPEQEAYWKLNGNNGNMAMWGINRMPFVFDPHEDASLDRDTVKNRMYRDPSSPGSGTGGGAGPTGSAAAPDLLSMVIEFIKNNPEQVKGLLGLVGNTDSNGRPLG